MEDGRMHSEVRVTAGRHLPVSLAWGAMDWLGGWSPWSLRNLRLKSPEKDTFSLLPLMLFLSCSMSTLTCQVALEAAWTHGPVGPTCHGLQLGHKLSGQMRDRTGLQCGADTWAVAFILALPKTRWDFSHGGTGEVGP